MSARSLISLTRNFTTTCPHGYKAKAPVNPSEASRRVERFPDSKIDLPPISHWDTCFPQKNSAIRDRVSVRNPKTAAAMAESFVPKGSYAKIVLEAFPGPGTLTRALLGLPQDRIQKLIVLEDHPLYLEYLRPLEKVDPRIHVVPIPGFSWDAYVTIEDMGLLDDVQSHDWGRGVHPQLQFISHLPRTVLGEQLIAQLFRGIPEKSWLFKYGRVPMNFILSDWVWQRISAHLDHPGRCKLSVIAEAVSHVNLTLPSRALQPYDDHFHPVYHRSSTSDQKPETRRMGHPFQAINITPRQDQIIRRGMLEKWDYCLRHLFVLKSKSLKSAIAHLAPGAQVLIKNITDPDRPDSQRVDVRKQVRKLTIDEWSLLIEAFHQWSFAPEDLSTADSLSADKRT